METSDDKRLTWDEIVREYPNQEVGLTEVEWWYEDASVVSAVVSYSEKTTPKSEIISMAKQSNGRMISVNTTKRNTFENVLHIDHIQYPGEDFDRKIINVLGKDQVRACIPFSLEELLIAYSDYPSFKTLPTEAWNQAAGFPISPTDSADASLTDCPLTRLYHKIGVDCYSKEESVSILKKAARDMAIEFLNSNHMVFYTGTKEEKAALQEWLKEPVTEERLKEEEWKEEERYTNELLGYWHETWEEKTLREKRAKVWHEKELREELIPSASWRERYFKRRRVRKHMDMDDHIDQLIAEYGPPTMP